MCAYICKHDTGNKKRHGKICTVAIKELVVDSAMERWLHKPTLHWRYQKKKKKAQTTQRKAKTKTGTFSLVREG